MADRFEDVPPLPREPTAINVPAAMANPPTTPSPAPPAASSLPRTLPPPPKFPSLTDVDLANAKAAAAAQGLPQHPSSHASDPSTASLTAASYPSIDPSIEPASVSDVQPLDSDSSHQPADLLSESTSSRPTSTLHEDIEAAIQRASVTPGTGERKVNEIAHQLWTPADQEELDRLLAEGREVFVPPDVETRDLPVPRSKPYYYVPIPTPHDTQSAVDTAPETRSMADRIALWNQVGTEESDSRSSPLAGAAVVGAAGAAVGAGAAAAAAGAGAAAQAAPLDHDLAASAAEHPIDTVHESSPVGDTTTRDVTGVTASPGSPDPTSSATEPLEPSAQSTTEKPVPTVRTNQPHVSPSNFTGDFLTVPVISRKAPDPASTVPPRPAHDESAETTEVMLRSDASANITIKDDFGLKGGHTAGCNDAVFLDEKNTLVTCGADGKVCIWDMTDRSVTKEFVPYEGEAVTMVYPMTDDDDGDSYTIMTLSESRLMRIWTVDANQAVVLRSTQIQSSDKVLLMSVPAISRELKVRATAAPVAAAETSVDAATAAAETTATSAPPEPDTAADAVVGDVSAAAETAPEASTTTADEKEEEKDRKRFSFSKVLSFGRSSSRKAVAS